MFDGPARFLEKSESAKRARESVTLLDDDPFWYKHSVFYEVMPRAFYDSNNDGIGDLRGLIEKLDYLQWLGIDCIWATPFFASPLLDGGYDVSDFFDVLPEFGTLDDAADLITELHNRGMRLIMDLPLNHTSDQHEWFQESRQNKTNDKADWYVWSDSNKKYPEVKCLFGDIEDSTWEWDHIRQQYFFHRFYKHQPDLNYDNPDVHEAILNVVDFWFGLGVDGFRLDAIARLYEREGSPSEGLPETHDFIKKLRAHSDANYKNRVWLVESDVISPHDALPYFGDDDEAHLALHFPLMPQLYLSLISEESKPVERILADTPYLPESGQWATFLRNHDELACHFLSPEQRAAMFAYYSPDNRSIIHKGITRRLAPLLKDDRKLFELLHALLLSLPGSPFLYYGDEVGMGDNPALFDRDGNRTPMHWDETENGGFSKAPPHTMYLPAVEDPHYGFRAHNVKNDQANPDSFLNWLRNSLTLRKAHKALGSGEFQLLNTANPAVLGYIRADAEERILCAANFSDKPQSFTLGLSAFGAIDMIDLFGHDPVGFSIEGKKLTVHVEPLGYQWFQLVDR